MFDQQELRLGPMEMADVRFLPWEEVALCHSEVDAINLCWIKRRPRISVADAAEMMGVSKGTVSKYLHGKLGMGADRARAFQWVCKNRAISQYAAWAQGCVLQSRELSEAEQREARIAELEAELEKARAA